MRHTYKTNDRVRIDACTDSRLAAKTNGQFGTILRRSTDGFRDYTVRLDNNPFVFSYSAMDLMPA